MGARKRLRAEERKEARKTQYFAKMNDCPSSPRKMRLAADLVRGKEVELALSTLKFANKDAAAKLYKLLLSAINNWQQKNEGVRMEDADLYVKEISVDGGRMLKRIQPAPQGRAHRVRKRSNHVTIVLGDRRAVEMEEVVETPGSEESSN
jgi:large subunit ribosomal protein L22